MGLDISLGIEKWVSYDKGKTHKTEMEYVYDSSMTHNLNTMAKESGIYKAIWRPEEISVHKAEGIIQLLEIGLVMLKSRPKYFKKFNSPNGWGTYEQFVPFVEEYLNSCKEYPNADIFVSR